MTLSQWALEDVEALCSETSFLMADPAGSLLDQDDKEAALSSLKEKGPRSPPRPYSPSLCPDHFPFSTMPIPASPPFSPLCHSATLTEKTWAESMFLPWLSDSSLLDVDNGADDCKGVSLCSPEFLLPSLDSQLDLDMEPFPTTTAVSTLSTSVELGLPLPLSDHLELPILEVGEDVEIKSHSPQEASTKSEPLSPAVSLSLPSSVDPSRLGKEGGTLDGESVATLITNTQDPSGSPQGPATPIVLSLPHASSIVLVLPDEKRPAGVPLLDQSLQASPSINEWDSDSGIESLGSSPTHILSLAIAPPTTATAAGGSLRTKPYAKPQSAAVPVSKIKHVSGAPKLVEKKLKKMEQNKTAATRYRHKKRIETELLGTELEELEKRNGELTEKAESISREIKYLKDLMEEVRRHHRGKTSSRTS